MLRPLLAGGPLAGAVRTGKRALAARHRGLVEESRGRGVADSLDLDAALGREAPNAPRWDYALGVRPSGAVVAMEVHAATERDVGAVVAKMRWAEAVLRRQGVTVGAWRWIVPRGSPVAIRRGSRGAKRLAAAAVAFPARVVRL